jgi:CheY-like chemotaxis protein
MKKRILVVDDEPDNSIIFKIALEDSEFEVDAFNNSTAALNAFRPNYYDLLVLDIRMPIMNGYELYEKVKKIDDKVKVCFLTAYGEHYTEEFKTRFTSSSIAGNISFIRKPIMLGDLVKKVNEMITQVDNQ